MTVILIDRGIYTNGIIFYDVYQSLRRVAADVVKRKEVTESHKAYISIIKNVNNTASACGFQFHA
jgi:hypothetical protein